MIKTCEYCDENFEARDNRNKYCSVKCHNKRNYATYKELCRQRDLFASEWNCFKGSREVGLVCGHGIYEKTDARTSKFADEAYTAGKNI